MEQCSKSEFTDSDPENEIYDEAVLLCQSSSYMQLP